MFQSTGMLRANDVMDVSDVVISVAVIVMCILFYYFKYDAIDLEDLGCVMMDFHKDPDYDDFLYVLNHKKRLPATVDYWLYGVYESQPQFIEFAEVTRGSVLTHEVRRRIERNIERCRHSPTAKILDNIWAVYFSSGNPKYPKMIADVACGRINAPLIVRESASWSYNSIMGQRPV